ncbi:DUF262 domain-containing protein [Streptococcus sp. HMSC070B10]|uniref:DUF262 domain-containing protein n=2 Tax=unclassified Streptococcus TaxID=2608887 RepID=UPI00164BFB1F|nr:DUF262 domain-containing protein [Streptococcus sp. HMSC070B10]
MVDDKYDLKSLLESYRIVIPLIQRDYAQGRKDLRTTEVRKQLLIDINSALINSEVPTLDLNFIYGKSHNGNFIPLDGQQRLTTLFLVYLFAFRDSDSCDFLSNFSYETRDSSKQFFTSLFEYRKSIFQLEEKPSEIIKDAAWFADSWILDPTIQGALVTLDGITDFFDFQYNYSEVLTLETNYRVAFNFLDIEDLGSEDELYIKLNSRGRPLTDFENFKARFISRVHELDTKLANDIALKLDTKWTDTIWRFDKNRFDINFLNLFEIALINNLDSLDYSQRENWTTNILFEDIKLEHIELIARVLDFLTENENSKVSQVLEKAITSKSIKDRVYFHFISLYLFHSGTVLDDKFKSWYRIFRNLTDNSEINSQERYERAIRGINEQINHLSDLIYYLSQNNKITGFSIEQVNEEIEKAKLIIEDPTQSEVIFNAENHVYFGGQIRSSFYFEDSDSTTDKYSKISSYWDKISAMFEATKPKEGILLRTALLSFGDYTLYVEGNKTLCQDDPNESSRTPSLKRLFSSKNQYVKKILDSIDINKPLELEYKRIIKENINSIDEQDWRYIFILYYKLMFSKMNRSHYRLKAPNVSGRPDEMLLIPNKNSRGRNTDIHLLALQEKLKEFNIKSDYESQPSLDTLDRVLHVQNLYEVKFYKDHYKFKKYEDEKYYKLNEFPASYLKVAEYLRNKLQ